MDTEEAEDQVLEDSEAGEWRDTGPGQDTQGYTLYHGRSAESGWRLREGIFV